MIGRPVPATEPNHTLTFARNVSTRYVAIAVEAALGLAVLPFNVAHLGTAAYGLWMLTASVTAYFSILDLGYSGALVKFVAQYRARRDHRALNEILSTAFVMFAGFGVLTYGAAILVAVFLDTIFQLTPDQVHTGRLVLLIVSVNVAVGTSMSVFGAVISGFQRYDLNNLVGAGTGLAVAAANVAVLALGYGLVELVACTTLVRLLFFGIYRLNAYRVFPELRVRAGLFRRARLRELTHFSVYVAMIDWANKLNYSVDALIIGAVLNTSAVAVWAVGQRVAEVTQRIANQLNEMLFPTIVDSDEAARNDRLQTILVQGTRLTLAIVMPLSVGLILVARPLVTAWVGPEFSGSVIVLQLLLAAVILRVGSATAATILKGAGLHRLLAGVNMTAALCNIAISLAVAPVYGLPGVALGTVIPIFGSAVFVIFPVGCRRVRLPLWRGWSEAVWPAVWPAAPMALYLMIVRPLTPVSLLAIGAELATGVVLYFATFLFLGIRPSDRQFYLTKMARLTGGTWPRPVSEGA
jgi:O-antigen/teichoic acid export membrane protein